jgi:hypothetical protein
MATPLIFKNRRLRVCHWSATPGFISAASAALDQQLRHLIAFDIVNLKALDETQASPCDLLIISAEGFDDDPFPQWLKSVQPRVPQAHGIAAPTIIFARISPQVQRELLSWSVEGNWYFDIVDPDHVMSLPVRVANFLRLHDHLHEVRRMSALTIDLAKKYQDVERQLHQLTGKSGTP